MWKISWSTTWESERDFATQPRNTQTQNTLMSPSTVSATIMDEVLDTLLPIDADDVLLTPSTPAAMNFSALEEIPIAPKPTRTIPWLVTPPRNWNSLHPDDQNRLITVYEYNRDLVERGLDPHMAIDLDYLVPPRLGKKRPRTVLLEEMNKVKTELDMFMENLLDNGDGDVLNILYDTAMETL